MQPETVTTATKLFISNPPCECKQLFIYSLGKSDRKCNGKNEDANNTNSIQPHADA